MKITVELDLTTCEGRAAMRAWLDATEAARPANVRGGVTAPGRADHANGKVREVSAAPEQVEPLPKPAAELAEPAPARREALATLARPLAEPWTPSTPSTPFAAPAEPVGQGADAGAEDPAPAPLDPDPPAPAPTPAPVDHDELALDPKRPWTEEDRRQAEFLNAKLGIKPKEVAERLRRDLKQVQNYLFHVRNGVTKSRLPAPSAAGRVAEEDDYRRPPVMAAEKVAAMRAELHERRCAREVREALYASRA